MESKTVRRRDLKVTAAGLTGAAIPAAANAGHHEATWGRPHAPHHGGHHHQCDERCAHSGQGEARAYAVPPFRFEEWTLADFRGALDSGEQSSESITRAYLERIEALDRQGPMLRSMLEVNPDALAAAAAADRARAAARLRSPLHGIPIVIKGNIDTADRMATSAGSLALAHGSAPRDAFLVTKLREAGAILLGKTNLSEWANFRSTRSSSGWSGVGGQCGNPFAIDRSPCGSSSGTGAAVSGNLSPIGVGTETDGSIVCPSAMCGIVGLKPTVGLVSRSGIIPISHSQDTAGPMARTVTDVALLLGAMTGVDPRDSATTAGADHAGIDYTRFLDARGLQGARLGVPRKRLFGYHDLTDKLIEEAITLLKREGAEVIELPELPHLGEYDESEYTVLLYEFKADLNAYLAARGGTVEQHSLAELIAWNERNRATSMPYFGQEIFVAAEEKGPLTEQAYLDALALDQRLSRAEGIDAVMAEHRLDALIAPTGSPAWPIDLVNGDHFTGASSSPAAVAGYPNITVPAGYVFGLPIGLSFFGRAWSEPTLLRLAFAFEQATRVRKPPRFLPSANLELG
ncbi:MAG: amidase [Candidatus Eisenbacteria bacterium]